MKMKREAFGLPLVIILLAVVVTLLTAMSATMSTHAAWQARHASQTQMHYIAQAAAERFKRLSESNTDIIVDRWVSQLQQQNEYMPIAVESRMDSKTTDAIVTTITISSPINESQP